MIYFLDSTKVPFIISHAHHTHVLLFFAVHYPFLVSSLRASAHSQQLFFAWVCFHTSRSALIDFYLSTPCQGKHFIGWCLCNSRNNRFSAMSTEALRLCWENVTSSKPAIVVNSSRDSNRILSKDRHSPTTRKCPNELQCRR